MRKFISKKPSSRVETRKEPGRKILFIKSGDDRKETILAILPDLPPRKVLKRYTKAQISQALNNKPVSKK